MGLSKTCIQLATFWGFTSKRIQRVQGLEQTYWKVQFSANSIFCHCTTLTKLLQIQDNHSKSESAIFRNYIENPSIRLVLLLLAFWLIYGVIRLICFSIRHWLIMSTWVLWEAFGCWPLGEGPGIVVWCYIFILKSSHKSMRRYYNLKMLCFPLRLPWTELKCEVDLFQQRSKRAKVKQNRWGHNRERSVFSPPAEQ